MVRQVEHWVTAGRPAAAWARWAAVEPPGVPAEAQRERSAAVRPLRPTPLVSVAAGAGVAPPAAPPRRHPPSWVSPPIPAGWAWRSAEQPGWPAGALTGPPAVGPVPRASVGPVPRASVGPPRRSAERQLDHRRAVGAHGTWTAPPRRTRGPPRWVWTAPRWTWALPRLARLTAWGRSVAPSGGAWSLRRGGRPPGQKKPPGRSAASGPARGAGEAAPAGPRRRSGGDGRTGAAGAEATTRQGRGVGGTARSREVVLAQATTVGRAAWHPALCGIRLPVAGRADRAGRWQAGRLAGRAPSVAGSGGSASSRPTRTGSRPPACGRRTAHPTACRVGETAWPGRQPGPMRARDRPGRPPARDRRRRSAPAGRRGPARTVR